MPLRIAHVVDYLMPDMGYQEYVLPKWNAKHGHDVHLVTSDRFAPVRHYREVWEPLLGPRVVGSRVEVRDGLRIHRLEASFELRMRPWLKGLEGTLDAIQPTVVMCHGAASFNTLRVARWCYRRRVPLVVDSHMTFVSQSHSALAAMYYRLLRFLTRHLVTPAVSRFVGLETDACRFLNEKHGVPVELIERYPFGVDTDHFRPDDVMGRAFREQHRIPAEAIVLLQTGKLTRDKAPELLARAALDLLASHDVWVVFAGGGPDKDLAAIAARFREAGHNERLVFVPAEPISTLPRVFCAADICVYPGGSSLSALEASSCAKAVVMTDLRGCQWRASQGIGRCFRAGSQESLLQVLEPLVRSKELREQVGACARKAIVDRYSYDRVADQIENLFDALATERDWAVSRGSWPPRPAVRAAFEAGA